MFQSKNEQNYSDFVHVGLEQEADPVGVVVHGEVGEPGAGVGVHHHLVPPHAVNHDGLASHRVLVIVLGRNVMINNVIPCIYLSMCRTL